MERLQAVVAVLGGLLLACSPAQAAETTVRISLQLPLASHLGQNLLLFKDEVERASAGAIQVQIFDSAQLFKDADVPQAVGSGAIEMGVASLTRFVGEIPAVDIFYIPFMFDSEELVRAATAKDGPVRGPIDEAIRQTGSRVLWWQAFGGAIMLSKGPEGLATPEAIRGKKVRVFGRSMGQFIQAVGGAPTLISGSEQFLAYQRGTVDAGMTGISAVQSRKLYEVMDAVTVTNHAATEFVVLINERFWEGLPREQREIIAAAALTAEAVLRDRIAEIEAAAYADARAHGMAVIELTADQLARWKQGAQPVLDAYLQASGPLGRQLHQAALALRQEN